MSSIERFDLALSRERDPAVRAIALRTRDAIVRGAPIGDVLTVVEGWASPWTEPLASLIAETYPIVALVRAAPALRDHATVASIGWVLQRRASAQATFETLLGDVTEEQLLAALDRFYAIHASPTSWRMVEAFASTLGIHVARTTKASHVALAFLERGAFLATVMQVLASRFSDEEVVRALVENGIGYEHSVVVLWCVGWSPARITDVLSKTDKLVFEVRDLLVRIEGRPHLRKLLQRHWCPKLVDIVLA